MLWEARLEIFGFSKYIYMWKKKWIPSDTSARKSHPTDISGRNAFQYKSVCYENMSTLEKSVIYQEKCTAFTLCLNSLCLKQTVV